MSLNQFQMDSSRLWKSMEDAASNFLQSQTGISEEAKATFLSDFMEVTVTLLLVHVLLRIHYNT